MKKVIILIPWFGPWPKWTRLYLESCRWNPTIDFMLIGDAPAPDDLPPNVRVVHYELSAFRDLAARKLNIKPRWTSPYVVCDYKPTLGLLFEDEIKAYDFWGFGDIDVIYGDIRAFLDEEALSHDIISNHTHIVSGHLSLLRNTPANNRAFMRVVHWKYLLEHQNHKSFDERIFSLMYIDEAGRKLQGVHRFLAPRKGGALLREQYSTPLEGLTWIDGSKNYPEQWYWQRGHLTTSNSGSREFMYLHFTHWASKRWTGTQKAVWDAVDPLIKVSGERPEAFQISAQGFEDLKIGAQSPRDAIPA